MCGKISLGRIGVPQLAAYFGTRDVRIAARNNIIVPGNNYPIVARTKKGNTIIRDGVWGFSPENVMNRVYNARMETFHDKALFKDAIPCVVPVNQFCEKSQWISLENNLIIPLAGICRVVDSNRLEFAINTIDSPDQLRSIHHRSPVPLKDWEQWLYNGLYEVTDYSYIVKSSLN